MLSVNHILRVAIAARDLVTPFCRTRSKVEQSLPSRQ